MTNNNQNNHGGDATTTDIELKNVVDSSCQLPQNSATIIDSDNNSSSTVCPDANHSKKQQQTDAGNNGNSNNKNNDQTDSSTIAHHMKTLLSYYDQQQQQQQQNSSSSSSSSPRIIPLPSLMSLLDAFNTSMMTSPSSNQQQQTHSKTIINQQQIVIFKCKLLCYQLIFPYMISSSSQNQQQQQDHHGDDEKLQLKINIENDMILTMIQLLKLLLLNRENNSNSNNNNNSGNGASLSSSPPSPLPSSSSLLINDHDTIKIQLPFHIIVKLIGHILQNIHDESDSDSDSDNVGVYWRMIQKIVQDFLLSNNHDENDKNKKQEELSLLLCKLDEHICCFMDQYMKWNKQQQNKQQQMMAVVNDDSVVQFGSRYYQWRFDTSVDHGDGDGKNDDEKWRKELHDRIMQLKNPHSISSVVASDNNNDEEQSRVDHEEESNDKKKQEEEEEVLDILVEDKNEQDNKKEHENDDGNDNNNNDLDLTSVMDVVRQLQQENEEMKRYMNDQFQQIAFYVQRLQDKVTEYKKDRDAMYQSLSQLTMHNKIQVLSTMIQSSHLKGRELVCPLRIDTEASPPNTRATSKLFDACGLTWNLRFYPKGMDEKDESHCAVFLGLDSIPQGFIRVHVDMKIILKGAIKYSASKVLLSGDTGKGTPTFCTVKQMEKVVPATSKGYMFEVVLRVTKLLTFKTMTDIEIYDRTQK